MADMFVTTAENLNLYLPVNLNASGSFGDTIFAGLAIAGSASINTNAYDYFTAGVSSSVASADLTTLTDDDDVLYDAVGSIAEASTFTDTQAGAWSVSNSISESFNLYLPLTLNASGSFGDTIFAGLAISGSASINENVYDYFTVGLGTTVAAADSTTFTDDPDVLYNAAGIVVESSVLTEVQSSQVNFVPSTLESLTLTDAQSGAWNTSSATAETITLTDTRTGIRGQFGSVADSITLTNTQAAIAAFAPQIAELLTLTELISIQSNLVGYIAETIVFSDAPIQRGWVKIINSQNPNWTDINNYQG